MRLLLKKKGKEANKNKDDKIATTTTTTPSKSSSNNNNNKKNKKNNKKKYEYDIEGRPLDPLDVAHLRAKQPFIMLLCGSDSSAWPSSKSVFEKRAAAAMKKVVKVTPILQTKIVAVTDQKEENNNSNNNNNNNEATDAESNTSVTASEKEPTETTAATTATTTTSSYIYTKHNDVSPQEDDCWPTIKVHFGDYTEEEVTSMIYQLEEDELQFYHHGGSDNANSTPIKVHCVRGTTRTVTLMVWPHSFLDGIGIGTFFVKLMCYWIVPKCLWFCTVDRLNTNQVPPFKQMALKQDYEQIMARQKEFESSPPLAKTDPNNFKFSDVSSDAPPKDTELIGGEFKFQSIDIALVNQARKEFRELGVSMSCAMSALSVRTFALILQKYNLNPDNRPLVASTPIDARNLSQWGDRRRDKKKRYSFPVVANYALTLCTQIPYDEALLDKEVGIVKMAARIKQDIARLQSTTTDNLDYRAKHVFHPGYPACGILLGTSSVMVPRMIGIGERTGVRDPRIYSRGHFGTTPHVWFTICTMDGICSNPHFFIGLPPSILPGLDRAQIFECVQEAVSGTPFDGFFRLRGDGYSTPTPV